MSATTIPLLPVVSSVVPFSPNQAEARAIVMSPGTFDAPLLEGQAGELRGRVSRCTGSNIAIGGVVTALLAALGFMIYSIVKNN